MNMSIPTKHVAHATMAPPGEATLPSWYAMSYTPEPIMPARIDATIGNNPSFFSMASFPFVLLFLSYY